jgi:predicted  nucleic acid-binding Zn-ribbon protein
MRFADIRTEWRVEQIERDIQQKADQHEIYTLRSTLDSLERTVREASTNIDGLRYELEVQESRVRELEQEHG